MPVQSSVPICHDLVDWRERLILKQMVLYSVCKISVHILMPLVWGYMTSEGNSEVRY
jgi:hypothetical protein